GNIDPVAHGAADAGAQEDDQVGVHGGPSSHRIDGAQGDTRALFLRRLKSPIPSPPIIPCRLRTGSGQDDVITVSVDAGARDRHLRRDCTLPNAQLTAHLLPIGFCTMQAPPAASGIYRPVMDNILTRLVRERGWLIADGATGTNMFALGLTQGDAPE